MPIRQIVCFVAVCDVCGTSETSDGYTPHADTEQAVIDIVTEKWGDPACGWTRTWDGRLVCDTVDDEAHRAAHEEAGKTISDCAMTVTFPAAEPAWWPEALAATRRRREYTAQLLAHATPTVEEGRLRLEFPDAGLVADWHDSRAGDALDGALTHLGRALHIEAVSLSA